MEFTRVIAHDRRGHGRPTQTWDGNDMHTYADDLARLKEKLDLKEAIHVGHSTGVGEVLLPLSSLWRVDSNYVPQAVSCHF